MPAESMSHFAENNGSMERNLVVQQTLSYRTVYLLYDVTKKDLVREGFAVPISWKIVYYTKSDKDIIRSFQSLI